MAFSNSLTGTAAPSALWHGRSMQNGSTARPQQPGKRFRWQRQISCWAGSWVSCKMMRFMVPRCSLRVHTVIWFLRGLGRGTRDTRRLNEGATQTGSHHVFKCLNAHRRPPRALRMGLNISSDAKNAFYCCQYSKRKCARKVIGRLTGWSEAHVPAGFGQIWTELHHVCRKMPFGTFALDIPIAYMYGDFKDGAFVRALCFYECFVRIHWLQLSVIDNLKTLMWIPKIYFIMILQNCMNLQGIIWVHVITALEAISIHRVLTDALRISVQVCFPCLNALPKGILSCISKE